MADQQQDATALKNLVSKIVAASKSIGKVAKDGHNTYSQYSFQSEAAIKAAVKPALESQGLTVVATYDLLNEREQGKNHISTLKGTFRVTDGNAELVYSMIAAGSDTLEKAAVKAETTAQKYFYKQLFNITDSDPDPDSEAQPSYQRQSTKQSPRRMGSQTQRQVNNLQQQIAAFAQWVKDVAVRYNADEKGIYKSLYRSANIPDKYLKNLTAQELIAMQKGLKALQTSFEKAGGQNVGQRQTSSNQRQPGNR
ncbi:ERF family protein [Lactobacillus rhamnosus]|uniref:ERF family protein n=1 Tax=Lacticaseibacillus rhamnosus TaxID=47715 RepID=A0A7Y7UIX8_LACRH|nr:ERF family protein [Lacticaseibacillus rhamnosus]NVO88917.1 ERF family protein [Lacticaseibacillus rhamnosus]